MAKRDIEYHVLGFVVKASVEGKKDFQPISKRYTSRAAAEAFRDIALKLGFADAFVTEVASMEAKDRVELTRRNLVIPPIKEGQ